MVPRVCPTALRKSHWYTRWVTSFHFRLRESLIRDNCLSSIEKHCLIRQWFPKLLLILVQFNRFGRFETFVQIMAFLKLPTLTKPDGGSRAWIWSCRYYILMANFLVMALVPFTLLVGLNLKLYRTVQVWIEKCKNADHQRRLSTNWKMIFLFRSQEHVV